jgi:hypothetical protein
MGEGKEGFSQDVIVNKIYFVREQKIMLDRDLAKLYGVDNRRLKEAVRRNIKRFPADFMFEMTDKELEIWMSQFATSNSEKLGIRHLPFCFTEQGVAQLSSVLNSEKAIMVNIQIIRIFTKLRHYVGDIQYLKLEIESIKTKLTSHSKNIDLVFQYLDELIEKKESLEREKETIENREMVGYKSK